MPNCDERHGLQKNGQTHSLVLKWLESPHSTRVFEAPEDASSRKLGPQNVYALLADDPIGRARGERCRVLYIGRGTSTRVQSLWNGGHSAIPALYRLYAAEGPPPGVTLHVREMGSREEAVAEEARLLADVAAVHGELPPCNLRWEGYTLAAWLRFFAERILASTGARDSKRKLLCYDWPDAEPRATWVDVYDDEWKWSVGWVWTPCWLPTERAPRARDLCGKLVFAKPGPGKTPDKDALDLAPKVVLAHEVDAQALCAIETPQSGRALFETLAASPAGAPLEAGRAFEMLAKQDLLKMSPECCGRRHEAEP